MSLCSTKIFANSWESYQKMCQAPLSLLTDWMRNYGRKMNSVVPPLGMSA